MSEYIFTFGVGVGGEWGWGVSGGGEPEYLVKIPFSQPEHLYQMCDKDLTLALQS